MREYKIIKTNLWYNVYKKKEENLERLGVNKKWTKDKNYAKLFYHKEDALSNLVLAKFKWEKGTEEILEIPLKSEGILEKKSWSEF